MEDQKKFNERADKLADIMKSKYNITEDEILNIYALLEAYKYLHKKTGAIPNCCFLNENEWTFSVNKTNNKWQVYLTERGNKEDLTFHTNITSAINKLIKMSPFDYEGNKVNTPEMIENDEELLRTSYKANIESYELMLPVVLRFRHHMISVVELLMNKYNGNVCRCLGLNDPYSLID